MFEDYLLDSYEFLSLAERYSKERSDVEARRYFRASVFCAAGAIEAYVNYIADSFAKAGSLPSYEISFLNDRTQVYSVDKGLTERREFHRLEEKTRLLLYKFVPAFDFQSLTWVKFMEFKDLRDSLVHPRQIDDETELSEYRKKVRAGLKSIIEVMDDSV